MDITRDSIKLEQTSPFRAFPQNITIIVVL